VTTKDLQKLFPELETWNDEEEARLEHLQMYASLNDQGIRARLIRAIVPKHVEREHQKKSALQRVYIQSQCQANCNTDWSFLESKKNKGKKK
jgi:hypothetical protein